MNIRNRLARLEQELEARESEHGYTMVVAMPAGGQGESRLPGVYADSDNTVTVVFEGPEPDEKVMATLAAKMAPRGMTIICEPDLGHNEIES
jgi:hypothetical protein